MGTLNPDQNFSVAVEQPIQPVDYSGLSSLVGTAVGGLIKKPEKTEIDNVELDTKLIRGLKKVRALRDSGKNREALTLETRLLGNYTRLGGNLGDTRIKTAVSGITGRDPEDFGNDPGQVAIQEKLQSEEFAGAYLGTFATHPDASPEERQEIALGVLAQQEGREAIIANSEFIWSTEGEEAFKGMITDFENQLFGAVGQLAHDGAGLTLDEIRQGRLLFNDFRSRVNSMRPTNVSNEEWSAVTDRLNQTQKQIEYIESISGPEGIAASAVSNIQHAIKGLEVSDFDKNVLLKIFSSDPAILTDLEIISFSDMKQALESLQSPIANTASLRDPDFRLPTETDRTPEQVYNNFKGATTGVNLVKDIVSNPNSREAWGEAVTTSLNNMQILAGQGEWMTSEQYETLFTPQFFAQMDALSTVDPQLHRALSTRAQEALTTTGMALQARVQSIVADSPVTIHPDGSLTLTESGLKAKAQGIPKGQDKVDYLVSEAIATYGGEAPAALTAMLADKGMRMADDPKAMSAYNALLGDLGDNHERAKQLASSIFNVSSIQRKLATGSASNLISGVKRKGNVPLPAEVASDLPFLSEVQAVSTRLGINPDHMLRAIDFETAGTFDPALDHAGSTATGLIGFLEGTAKGLGYTIPELKRMSRAEQMAVVEQYLTPYLKNIENPTFGDVYLAIHYPAAVGKGDAYPLYVVGSKEYEANKSLDTTGDGVVTAGEAVSRAWGASSSGSRLPSDIGQQILSEANSGSGEQTQYTSSNPPPLVEPVTVTPLPDAGGTSSVPSAPSGEAPVAESGSKVATEEQKELLLTQFPTLGEEGVEEILRILSNVKTREK